MLALLVPREQVAPLAPVVTPWVRGEAAHTAGAEGALGAGAVRL